MGKELEAVLKKVNSDIKQVAKRFGGLTEDLVLNRYLNPFSDFLLYNGERLTINRISKVDAPISYRFNICLTDKGFLLDNDDRVLYRPDQSGAQELLKLTRSYQDSLPGGVPAKVEEVLGGYMRMLEQAVDKRIIEEELRAIEKERKEKSSGGDLHSIIGGACM